jgi:hypothetical protein
MANAFGQLVLKLWNDKQDDVAMQVLPVDMRLETFVLGTLTGLMSVSLQMAGLQNIDRVVDSTEQYLAAAADHARFAILEARTKDSAN